MKMRTSTTHIVIHCADTYEDMDIGAEDIRKWHVEERGWSDIGYHKVIRRDGTVEDGRDLNVSGCLLYTSPSPRDAHESRMPSSA